MKYFIIFFFLFFLVWALIFSHPNKLHKSNENAAPAVSTIIAKLNDSSEVLKIIGTVKASQSIQLSSEVSGVIDNINFYSGQAVAKDQPLMNLRNDDLRAALDKANVKFSNDQKIYKRSKRLLASHVIAVADVDQADAQMQQDRADINQQQALLKKYIISAPFSGILGISEVTMGQYITAGQAITHLEQLNPVYVDASIPDKLMSKIHLNDSVGFTAEAYPNQSFFGKVAAIDNVVDVTTRSLKMRIECNNPNQLLRSGMAVKVSLKQVGEKEILLPESVVSYSPDGSTVYVVDKNNRVHQRLVTFSHRQDGQLAILSGIYPGEKLVSTGQQSLSDGLFVNINNEEAL
jgi:membrane fusion protein (multidrug efflux system)